MAVSALQASNSVPAFEDPYDYTDSAEEYRKFAAERGVAPGGFISKIGQWFGFGSEDAYENYKLEADRDYERASINSARAWEQYLQDTQTQRRVQDIEAAGLNPWLAVQDGISGTGNATADTGGSAQHQNQSGQSKTFLGMLLMSIAKLLG